MLIVYKQIYKRSHFLAALTLFRANQFEGNQVSWIMIDVEEADIYDWLFLSRMSLKPLQQVRVRALVQRLVGGVLRLCVPSRKFWEVVGSLEEPVESPCY